MFFKFKKYGIGNIYDDHVETATLDLDKVEVAGGLRLDRLSVRMFPFVAAAICILMSDVGSAAAMFSELRINHGLRIRPEYSKREEELLKSELIVAENVGALKFLSGYFEVVKPGSGDKKDSARAIINAKRLSQHCVAPLGVNLPELPTLLRHLSALHDQVNQARSRAKMPSVVSADLRHWFHQVPVSAPLSRYFGIQFDNGSTYRWKNLAMGWSHSCRIAQCLTWGLILACFMATPPWYLAPAAELLSRSEHPPTWSDLYDSAGQICGCVFVWYDNVVSIIYDTTVKDDFVAHLRKAAEKTGCVWKCIDVTNASEMPRERATMTSATFLGLQLACTLPKTSRDGTVISSRLIWRHAPEKIDKWIKASENLTAQGTCRAVARCVGLLVWDCYMSCRHLCTIDDILQAASDNSPANVRGWDEATTISSIRCAALAERVRQTSALNTWHSVHASLPSDPVVLAASDSSDNYGGYVIFGEDDEMAEVKTLHWTPAFRQSHIFLKELLAACVTVERIATSRPSAKKIYLACDNTAVVHVLAKMWSTNGHALAIVKRLSSLLNRRGIVLEVVPIRGVDNVADDPSRLRACSDALRIATLEQIRRARHGLTKTQVVVKKCTSTTGVRHDETGRFHFLEQLANSATRASVDEDLSKANLEVDFGDAGFECCIQEV